MNERGSFSVYDVVGLLVCILDYYQEVVIQHTMIAFEYLCKQVFFKVMNCNSFEKILLRCCFSSKHCDICIHHEDHLHRIWIVNIK